MPSGRWAHIRLPRSPWADRRRRPAGVIGATDTPLDEPGERQAVFWGERFAAIPSDAVISSTLVRVKETSERIAARVGKSVEINPEFAGIDFGDLEQRTIARLKCDRPELALPHATQDCEGVT